MTTEAGQNGLSQWSDRFAAEPTSGDPARLPGLLWFKASGWILSMLEAPEVPSWQSAPEPPLLAFSGATA